MTDTLPIGTRVVLLKAVDVGFDGYYEAGETGTLESIDSEGAHWITLDKHHPELTEWNNRVQIWDYSEQDGADAHPSTFYVAEETK